MSKMRYYLLYRMIVDLTIDEAAWCLSTFRVTRDRMLAHDVVGGLFEIVVTKARALDLLLNFSTPAAP